MSPTLDQARLTGSQREKREKLLKKSYLPWSICQGIQTEWLMSNPHKAHLGTNKKELPMTKKSWMRSF